MGGMASPTLATTMKTKSRITKSPRLLMAALAGVVSMAGVTSVHAEDEFKIFNDLRPGSVYAAGNIALLNNSLECQGAAVCQHARTGGKLFGGYRFTPNLATEIGVYYLGRFEATKGVNVPAGEVASRIVRNKAVSVGIDWSNELFQVLNQHIRFGIARVSTTGTIAYGNGATIESTQTKIAPYAGLGLSYQFNPYVRFYQGYDVFRTKNDGNIHVFSMGLGVEN